MESDEIWRLIGKKLSGEASPEDLDRLNSLLENGLGDIYPMHVIEDFWKQNAQSNPDEQFLDFKWNRLHSKLEDADRAQTENLKDDYSNYPSRLRIHKKLFVSIAALFLIVSGVCFYMTAPFKGSYTADVNTEYVPLKKTSRIKLPDGTRVWLNSGSRLTYDPRFKNGLREVTLSGEALFDVVKDPDRPFIVNTPSLKLRVLGTVFNVRSYANDRTAEASLISGKVKITLPQSSGREIILNPSEKLTVANGKIINGLQKKITDESSGDNIPIIALSYVHQNPEDSLPAEALWTENKLVFDGETFEDIGRKLERRYDVFVQIKKSEDFKRLRFSGKFKDESLSEIMKALQETYNFSFKIYEKQVIIY